MTETEKKLYFMLRRLANSCQTVEEASGYVICEPDPRVLGEALVLLENFRAAFHAE